MATDWQRLTPLLITLPHASRWLILQSRQGLKSNTLVAYGRAVIDYVTFCQHQGVEHECARREQVANYVHHLATSPVVRKDLSVQPGFSNATMQQRIVAVRLYYEFLKEEGVVRENPITRGKYTKSKGFGGSRRGLLPHYKKLPWIPGEGQWSALLAATSNEPVRNRLMLSMAYDAGLRREELCSLRVDDIDPSQRLITIRAEITKTKRARVVPYSEYTAKLFALYTRQRRAVSRDYGLLFLSESRRNRGKPLTIWTWSKVVHRLALDAGLPKFSTHTLRHLCLTDLARIGWEAHEIATFAGHRSIETTMQYIHLSSSDLAAKLTRATDSIRDQRLTGLQGLKP